MSISFEYHLFACLLIISEEILFAINLIKSVYFNWKAKSFQTQMRAQ